LVNEKALKRTYAIVILVAVLIGALVAHWFLSLPPVFLSISSPNNHYRVDLRGDKSRPLTPFINHSVSFDMIKNESRMVRNAHAHWGDWFDISFELAYPEHRWVNEQVLRFGHNLTVNQNTEDRLSLVNRSGKAIKYLRINANDMFLVFDLAPQSNLELTSSHQSWSSWIEGEGQFINGESISSRGVNFFHRNMVSAPLTYCIVVDDGGLRIDSPQMEGYAVSLEKPDVAKAQNCNL